MKGVSLLGVLMLCRVLMLQAHDIEWATWTVIGYFWQDALIALLFSAIEKGVCRWRGGRSAAAVIYWIVVAYAAINTPLARELATPLTVPMLRATGYALTDSVLTFVTPINIALITAICGSAALLPRTLKCAHLHLRAVMLAALLVVLAGPFAAGRVDTAGLHRNPVIAFTMSALPRVDARKSSAEWTTPPFEPAPADDLSGMRGLAAGRNVVLVSLESTGAQYLRLYGGIDDVTPNLDRLARKAVVFDNAYAVTPESIKGLFSVLCSRYPAFDTPSDAYAATACESIASVLAAAGYRTAMFHSGRFGYLGMDAVIRNRGFETLEDAGDIGGNRESSFGVDEPAAVERMLAWVDTLASSDRFFLAYLPIAGHHPYATSQRGPFPDDDELGRYRNALHDADRSLGALMDGVRTRGLENNTLWIVYGDHGEAFGQHAGNYGHTFFLYDENVRVPFIVAVPGAIDETIRSRTTVSLVDTAPTLFGLLGMESRVGHQGRSAIDGSARMALFFTDYSLSLAGLRDGRWKSVLDLSSGRSRLFDVESDPAETIDLSASHGVRVAAYERLLRGWSAAQKAMMEER